MSERIDLEFVGVDAWDRCVFKGDNGRYYKTIELVPSGGFTAAFFEEHLRLLRSLHSTDKFEGEPNAPVKLSHFTYEGVDL